MKIKLLALAFLVVIIAVSCGKDDDIVATEVQLHEPFFFNFKMGPSEFSLTENDARLSNGTFSAGCISSSTFVGGFGYGMRTTKFVSHLPSNNEVTSVNLGITQKVGIIDLNLVDDFSYIRKVLGREGEWKFPTVKEGFAPIRNDLDFPATEVYLDIVMGDGRTYTSILEEIVVRYEESFFNETRVLNLGEFAPKDYTYIIEANFKVDLYEGGDLSKPVIVEGDLRLPIYTFTTTEAKLMCD